MEILINSNFKIGKSISQYSNLDIEQEPMFFSCDVDYAFKNGGPITKEFLQLTNQDGIFDSRSHMLMKGWYPCIPGWHHDDVPRNTSSGQPNYFDPEYKADHCLALINGDICPTNFAIGDEIFVIPDIEKTVVYEEWDKKVNELIASGKLKLEKVPSNKLVYFNWMTFHEGTQAVKDGWRWFGRLSWNTHRKIENKIRKQVQVYLEFPKKGW